ncbi:MAG: Crp/Fnr family transcriptional regulator [Chitinophagaceae bacterium]
MSATLESHIKKFIDLSPEQAAMVTAYAKPVQAKKKTFLLKEGQICASNYFVERGCLRMFFTDEKGVEQTTQFAIENWWLTDYASFCSNKPSQFSIQAVEHSTIIAFDKTALDQLFTQLPQLERYFRLLLEKTAGATQWRVKYIYDLSKEEMYRFFSASYPDFVQRVPQYMLASYLGLTPEYLSEIRKKK